MDRERLRRWFLELLGDDAEDLPLYAALCRGAASDEPLLDLLVDAAPGQWRPTLLLAAVHDLVLRHPDEPLSRLYPTVGGSFGGDDPMPRFREFVAAHLDEVRRLVATRSTQTNEPNRCCLWQVAARAVAADLPGVPVAWVEVGASAGLNLGFDRYRYHFDVTSGGVASGDVTSGGVTVGDASSAVALACDLRGDRSVLDLPMPAIVERVGIDVAPVDLRDAAEHRWLKACIWPEQPDRHARFDAAVAATLADPPRLVADDAVDGIADVVEDLPAGVHVVVANSWAMTYLARDRRAAFESIVDELGRTRNLTRVSAEAETVVGWVPRLERDEPQTVVGVRRWRGGERTESRVAHCHPHLRWLDWFGVEPQPSSVP